MVGAAGTGASHNRLEGTPMSPRPVTAEQLYVYHCGQADALREALLVLAGRNGMATLRWMVEIAQAIADEQERIVLGRVPA